MHTTSTLLEAKTSLGSLVIAGFRGKKHVSTQPTTARPSVGWTDLKIAMQGVAQVSEATLCNFSPYAPLQVVQVDHTSGKRGSRSSTVAL